jgi:hypothetical protein
VSKPIQAEELLHAIEKQLSAIENIS